MSVVENTVELLKERIKQWHYAPGQRLVESDLEKELKVGRSTVREALRKLAGDGYVVNQPNKGTIVRRFSGDDVLHVYQVREAIEGLAARLAAENIGHGDYRQRLRSLHRRMKSLAEADDIAGYMDLNEEFHNLILGFSENPWLVSLAERLWLPIFRIQFNFFVQKKSKQASQAGHDRIIGAILDGDAGKADRLMRAHIRSSRKHFQEMSETGLIPR